MFFALLLITCVAFSVFQFIAEKNGTPKSDKVIEVQVNTEPQSAFKTAVDDAVNWLSDNSEIKYVLDENYYNEYVAKTYVATLNGVNTENIQKEHILACKEKLFTFVKKDENKTFLIQKDKYTLLEECESKGHMNHLDYKYLGTINDEIAEQSKGVYLSQNKDDYLNMPYGNSNVKYSGCGPAALTMALNYISESNVVTLETIVDWANLNDMYVENVGTRWALIKIFPTTLGFRCEEMHINNVQKLTTLLSEGQVLITSMKKGHFTDSGHFIAITDITDGMVTVLDSASIYRSLKKWDVQLIFDESSKFFWKIYK